MRLIDADKLLRDIEHYNLSDGKFQHWVEIQPTVEPELHWIPCSERSPEVNDTYLVSYEDASVLMDWFNGYWFFYQTNPAVKETGTVIAWMPRPEPYQPKEEAESQEPEEE